MNHTHTHIFIEKKSFLLLHIRNESLLAWKLCTHTCGYRKSIQFISVFVRLNTLCAFAIFTSRYYMAAYLQQTITVSFLLLICPKNSRDYIEFVIGRSRLPLMTFVLVRFTKEMHIRRDLEAH